MQVASRPCAAHPSAFLERRESVPGASDENIHVFDGPGKRSVRPDTAAVVRASVDQTEASILPGFVRHRRIVEGSGHSSERSKTRMFSCELTGGVGSRFRLTLPQHSGATLHGSPLPLSPSEAR